MDNGDLINDLRAAARRAEPAERSLYLSAADEIERCHRRLEIDRAWGLGQDGDDLVPMPVPYGDRAGFPDGIMARDATIAALERTPGERLISAAKEARGIGQAVAQARCEALIYAAEMAERFGADNAAEGIAMDDKGAYAHERREIEEEMNGLAVYLRKQADKGGSDGPE